MTATITHLTPSATEARENRIRMALLRSVVDQLRPNRLTIPIFAALTCAIFAQWVPFHRYAAWYALVMASLAPALLLKLPKEDQRPHDVQRWAHIACASNLAFVLAWSSLGLFLWVPDSDFNHILVQLVLAATLSSHAALVGSSRDIARPSFLLFGLVMTITPLQDGSHPYLVLALISPFYVLHVALIARQQYARARAALELAEDKNALMAELVRAKRESDAGRERAEAASLAKSQFLANMSHELRTPLNAIIGFSELIATRMFANAPERNYEYAGLIHSSGHHLLNLINDILDLAKIEAGRWRLDEGEVDVSRVMEDAMQLVVWKAKDNGAALALDIRPGLPLVWGDERAIKQMMLNLLSNAVKFTQDGGAVTAFAGADDGGLYFGVSDTGIGIATEDQQKVFDSFGQGKHDVAIADKGTGLGLAIVKGLAEAHGGHVTLESEVGKGTRVTVHLPASRVRRRQEAA
jgi:two-component system cell cycle sensor histidine kinase PleC